LGDYLGIGPGAHGRLTVDGARLATETMLSPEGWIVAVQERGHGIAQQAEVSPGSCGEEYLLMSLRLTEGMSLKRFEALSGHCFDLARAAQLLESGMLALDGDTLRVSATGRPVLNAVIAELLV